MKRIICFICMLFVSFTSIVTVNASEIPVDSYISIPVSDTEVWVFPTEEDYELYLNDVQIKSESSLIMPLYVTEQEISRTTWYHKWVCYHWLTPSWIKASSYTVNAGTVVTGTASASYAGIAFSLSLSKKQEVTATIPANSSKYSRLSLSGDFLVKKMRRFYHDNSGVYNQYDYISYKVLNSYIDVTYQ